MFELFLMILLFIAAGGALYLACLFCPQARVPLAVYCGAYFATTALGSILVSFLGSDLLVSLNYGLDVTVLQDLGSFKYWALLLAPLIVPPLLIFVRMGLSRELPRLLVPGFVTRGPNVPLDLTYFNVWFAAGALYCVGLLFINGYLGNLLVAQEMQGDYLSLISLRTEMAGSLGSTFFGLVFIGLQTLSFCALYQLAREGTLGWRLTFIMTVVVCSLLCLSVFLKGQVLLYYVMLGLGCLELGLIRKWKFFLVPIGILLLLSLLQTVFTGKWAIVDTVELAIFRMGVSFPYYLNLFPDVLPFYGADLGLHLVHLDLPKTYSFDVSAYMYPAAQSIEGAACPAPSHMMAYAELGVFYSVLVLGVTGFLILQIARIRTDGLRGPLSFAFYLTSLMFLYTLTQTSLREAVISCYGIFWGFVVLAPLYVLSLPRFLLIRRTAPLPALRLAGMDCSPKDGTGAENPVRVEEHAPRRRGPTASRRAARPLAGGDSGATEPARG